MKLSLRKKIIIVLVVFAVLLSSVAAFVSWRTISRMSDRQYKNRADELAATVARVIQARFGRGFGRKRTFHVLAEDVVVDIRTRSVRRNGTRINLTDKEFDILRYFMEHRGEVVQNKDLYESVWGEKYLPSAGNTIMVHVLNLRKKLEDDVRKSKIIKTVWGKGYRIE